MFVLFMLMPWLSYSSYRCLRFPLERKLRIQQASVWFVAIAVIASVHLVRYQSAKNYAQGISDQIEAYIASHGTYPAKLEDIGISKSAFKEHLGFGGYVYENQTAFLFYSSTYDPFDTEIYDFEQHQWQHNYD